MQKSPWQCTRVLSRDPQVVVDHERAIEHVGLRPLLEAPGYGVEPLGVHHVVVVEVRDDLATGRFERGVAGGRDASLGNRRPADARVADLLHRLPRSLVISASSRRASARVAAPARRIARPAVRRSLLLRFAWRRTAANIAPAASPASRLFPPLG